MRTLLFSVFLLLPPGLFAQWSFSPLGSDARGGSVPSSVSGGSGHSLRSAKSTGATLAVGDTIGIPFFDDFSTYEGIPNSTRWLTSGGVYVNPRYALNPPTIGTATFDGLQGNGTPYLFPSTTSPTAGPSDTLSSLAFDLSARVPNDSVALSFYYQRGGLAPEVAPELVDSLVLYFWNASNAWVNVWSDTGYTSVPTTAEDFSRVYVRLIDPAYLHAGFRFRFIAYGRLDGNWDQWHLDWVLLDQGRQESDETPDFGFSTPPTSYLRDYWQMPINQYMFDPATHTADTIYATIQNLSNDGGAFFNSVANTLRDTITGIAIEPTSIAPDATPVTPNTPYQVFWEPDETALTGNGTVYDGDFLILRTTLAMNPPASDLTPQNDTTHSFTTLANLYAYDDGSCEFAVGLNAIGGQVAIRYTLSTPDTLSEIFVYFPGLESDQSGRSFRLKIWQDLGGVDAPSDTLVEDLPRALVYTDSLNKFYKYTLPVPIALPAGDFFIGWEQTSISTLYFGYDLNSPRADRIYENLGGGWQLAVALQSRPGAIMLRPKFGFVPSLITGVDGGSGSSELEARVYPNPTDGILNIEGTVSEAIMIDLMGRTVARKSWYGHEALAAKSWVLPQLPEGMYVLHLSHGSAARTERVLVIR